MKLRTRLLVITLGLTLIVAALTPAPEPGKFVFPIEFGSESKIVARETLDARGKTARYMVYLPKGYASGSKSYPVLYLLHGASGNETSWSNPDQGNMKEICDRYFARRRDRKMIVVMPDGRDAWYRNAYDSDDAFEDYFFNALIPSVEREFRCKTNRKNRAVAGLSMGGYGTLLYATRHAEQFGVAVAMSPAVYSLRERNERNGVVMDEARRKYEQEYDVVAALDHIEWKDAPRIMIDCGDEDFCLKGAYEFFQKARDKYIPVELRVRDGKHEWEYWRVSLVMALDFFFEDSRLLGR